MQASVLDALESLRAIPESVPALRSTAWLSTRKGPRAPNEIIDIRGAEENLTAILDSAEHDSRVIGIESIAANAREHAAFRLVRRSLLLHGRAASEALGTALAQDPAFRLGPLRASVLEDGGVETLLQAFEGVAVQILPGAAVVEMLRRAVSDPDAPRLLAKMLVGDVGVERIKGCLRGLAEKHAGSRRTERHDILDVHGWYLRALVELPGVTPMNLTGLSLLSRKESWRAVEELCLGAHGVDPDHVLGEQHARLLEAFVPSSGEAATDPADTASHDADRRSDSRSIGDYLRDFELHVAPEVLGGFAAVLGDDQEICDKAQEYLEPRWSLRNFRQRIDWEVLPSTTEPGSLQVAGAGEDVHAAMSKQRFLFRVARGGAEQAWSVLNLLGDQIQVPMSAEYDDLIVGQFRNAPGHGYRTYEISLRGTDPATLPRPRLINLFRDTAAVILDKVYCQAAGNLGSLWSELAESEQLDLEVSQRLVLDHALFYVRQLGGRDSEIFARFGRYFDDIRYREAELERLADDVGSRRELDERRRALRNELSECLSSDPRAQRETLAAVRSKVIDFQYEPSSIPFELFQNGDDAAVELRQMLHRDAPPSQATKMAVSWNGSEIVFVYWGRPINQFRLANFPSSEGRRLGYHRDLEKMLVMSSSDKSEEDDLVTGKFGLGFKSVFLFTDRPLVLSGRLGFQVLGGIFPQKLPHEDSERLNQHALAYSSGTRETTVIELGRSEEVELEPNEVLESFRELGHFLPVFSRSIKSIELREGDDAPEHLTWEEKSLRGSEHLFTGALRPSRGSSHSPTPAVVIRGARGAALLLATNARGFAPLPEGTPTFWVTAPTRSMESAGFAFNAPLLLDVGRGRLGAVEGNLDIAREFGATIGSALLEAHDLARDWDSFAAEFGLSLETSEYEFWRSLWEVMSGTSLLGDGIEPRLLRTAIWSKQAGLRRLFEERKALPTWLPGDYEALTALPAARSATYGELDSPSVFESASALASFRSLATPGSLISGSRIADRLEPLLEVRGHFRRLGITDVLEAELESGREIDSKRASAVGAVFNSELISRLDRPGEPGHEAEVVSEMLSEFHFETQTGSFAPAQDLLVSSPDGATVEERLRAAFAPTNRVLSALYDDSGRQFFRVCRREMRAPAELLADWGVAAGTDDERRAFMEYLLGGQLASQVAAEIRSRGVASWIDSLRESDLMHGMAGPDQLVLLGRIGFDEDRLTSNEPISLVQRDPGPVLEALHEWWSVHRDEELSEYQKRVYPDGGALLDSLKNAGPRSDKEREAWLTLLLRASLETLGWFSDEQNREFLRLCTKRNWIQDLAHGASPETLVKHLVEYVKRQSDQIPFFHWLGQYSKLYIMANWIDAYAQSFVDVNLMASEPSLRLILSPRANPEYSGGGPDAPPLQPLLGIGACFALRELRRTGIITNPKVDPLCFVPGKTIRTLIEEIGGPGIGEDEAHEARSRAIWDFLVEQLGLERATFQGDFDIPLMILAKRPELRDHLLSRAGSA